MHANHTDYGATQHVANNPFGAPQQHVTNNPFASGAAGNMMEENVQPMARDVYMHGTVDDRNY